MVVVVQSENLTIFTVCMRLCDDQYQIIMSSKQPCRYGASCYRKNSHHLKSFSHPREEEAEQDSAGKRPSAIMQH